MFFSNTRWTQILAPLEILISKISLKYIPIHIYNFEHSWWLWTWNSSHGFLFHRNINRRENKAKLPHHHNEKKQRIYFWCAAKDNWASQISEVALRKELEQWTFPFPPSGQWFKFPINMKCYETAWKRTSVYIILMHSEKESLSG